MTILMKTSRPLIRRGMNRTCLMQMNTRMKTGRRRGTIWFVTGALGRSSVAAMPAAAIGAASLAAGISEPGAAGAAAAMLGSLKNVDAARTPSAMRSIIDWRSFMGAISCDGEQPFGYLIG
ncbi:MAG: hypothetical protein NTZ05_13385 [Chloroflexi bacterium]|nr:hypothetical protein [Chloroflexota bacterium]